MKIAVTTGSVSRLSGGLFASVRHFVQSVAACENTFQIEVFSPADQYSEEDSKQWEAVSTRVYSCIGPGAAGLSFSLLAAVRAFSPDILHQHGLWMGYSLAKAPRGKKIISTHGMLDPWALNNSMYKKKIAALAFENRNLQGAACLHALCEQEYLAIRNYGLTNPVCIIPNGVTIRESETGEEKRVAAARKTLLYLGRIHPKKGLESLLKAWAMLGSEFRREWQLVIAGWGAQHYIERLTAESEYLRLGESVFFCGPQYGELKKARFEEADCFILPSLSEGLPMVVLEAWSYGLPVLMTRECNIPEGFGGGAAVEIESDPDSLAASLTSFLSFDSAEMREMGKRGYSLVKNDYNWSLIGRRMYSVYNWMLGQQPVPDCIRLD